VSDLPTYWQRHLSKPRQQSGTFPTTQMAEKDAQNVGFLLAVDAVREALGYGSGNRSFVSVADAESLKAADEFRVLARFTV
jgi:hypothetical protein